MITTILTGLTTIFTPPSTCSSSWTYEAEIFNSVPGGLLLQNALPNYLDTECFPTGFDYAGRAPDTTEVFSPGACPMGYTTATESFNSGTTLAVCCQNDFVYSSLFSQKDQFNTTTVLFAGCLSTFTGGSTAVQARSGLDDSGLNYTTITGVVTMWGQPISVEFQQQDLTLFTTSTSISASVSTSTSTTAQPSISAGVSTSTSTTAQPSNTVAQPYASPTVTTIPSSAIASGLSIGAKAGIAIAAVIGGFLILASLAFLFLRRRSVTNRQPYAQQNANLREIKELDGWETHHPVEMPASVQVVELG